MTPAIFSNLRVRLEKFSTPEDKQLRYFGLIVATLIVIVFSFVLPFLLVNSRPIWPIPISFLLLSLALFSPQRLRSIFSVWMLIGELIGSVVSRVILAIIFFFLITPIGFLHRIFGGDSLKLEIDPSTDSYRETVDGSKHFDFTRPF